MCPLWVLPRLNGRIRFSSVISWKYEAHTNMKMFVNLLFSLVVSSLFFIVKFSLIFPLFERYSSNFLTIQLNVYFLHYTAGLLLILQTPALSFLFLFCHLDNNLTWLNQVLMKVESSCERCSCKIYAIIIIILFGLSFVSIAFSNLNYFFNGQSW